MLDFVTGSHSSEQLRENHRRVIEAFRAARPPDGFGRRCYEKMNDDPYSVYVCTEIRHHLTKGWDSDMDQDQLAVKGWLADVPQDQLTVEAACGEFDSSNRAILRVFRWHEMYLIFTLFVSTRRGPAFRIGRSCPTCWRSLAVRPIPRIDLPCAPSHWWTRTSVQVFNLCD